MLAAQSPDEQRRIVMAWIRHLVRQQVAVRRGTGTPQSHFDEQLADFFEHQLSDEERERLLGAARRRNAESAQGVVSCRSGSSAGPPAASWQVARRGEQGRQGAVSMSDDSRQPLPATSFPQRATRLIIRNLDRDPLAVGVVVGLLLAIAVSAFAPAADLKPGDSRVVMALVGAIFLVPGSVITAYAVRIVIHNFRQMPYLRLILAGYALFFTVAVAISAHGEWTAARRFALEGRSVDGRVVEPHPEDHDKLLVEYEISGLMYRTRSTGPRVARSYYAGDPIRVYYYLSAPDEGFCVEPRWRPDLLVASWVIAAGVFPLWIAALAVIWGVGKKA